MSRTSPFIWRPTHPRRLVPCAAMTHPAYTAATPAGSTSPPPRRLDDLPCLGRRVRLRVTVRRFACPQPDCPRRIFAERLPGLAAPRARTTDRLRQAHNAIGSALGGEAGSRLTAHMAMTTSPDTLLRRVKR